MAANKITFLLILTIIISCSPNPVKKMTEKKFIDLDNTAVFTTKFVTSDKKEITTVTHEKDDGAWQFFSSDHFTNFEDVAKVVGLGQVIKMDSTILELADLPLGYKAHRKFRGDKWIIEKIQSQQ